jgi:hypothetical protein
MAQFSSLPIEVIEYCPARIGLIGNPSDGFKGKTLSFLINNFHAKVIIKENLCNMIRTKNGVNNSKNNDGKIDSNNYVKTDTNNEINGDQKNDSNNRITENDLKISSNQSDNFNSSNNSNNDSNNDSNNSSSKRNMNRTITLVPHPVFDPQSFNGLENLQLHSENKVSDKTR